MAVADVQQQERTRERLETLLPEARGADHVDIHHGAGALPLRRFLSGMLGHRPWWVRLLFWLRGLLARLLGLQHELPPGPVHVPPQQIPMQPGQTFAFFEIRSAAEDEHWIGVAEDRHLRAYLGVLRRELDGADAEFAIATVVRYRHWAGPVYFNLIRPFHHLLVWWMMRRGLRS